MVGLWLWLCLVGAGATVGSVLPADRANSPCQPGSVWLADDGCNTCFCLDSGVAGCSRMECSAEEQGDKKAAGELGGEVKPVPLPEPDEKEAMPYNNDRDVLKPVPEPFPEPEPVEERSDDSCTPGEEWQEECNSCVCLGEGKAACTMMACLAPESRTMAEAVKDHCEAGTTWSDNCNVCHCVGDGQVICSYRFCVEAEDGSRRRRRQAGCTPGTSRQVDCNVCRCLPNGREACTFRFCLPESSQRSDGFSAGPARSAAGSSGCTRDCPAGCGSRRGDDGCLTCDCDNRQLFGARPPPPSTDPASASDRSWDHVQRSSDGAQEAVPYNSRQPWGRTDSWRQQRHSFFSDGERPTPHRHSAWGDIIADSGSDVTHDSPADGSHRTPARRPYGSGDGDHSSPPSDSDSGRYAPPGDDSSSNGFTSIGGFGNRDLGRFTPPGGTNTDRFSSFGSSGSSRFGWPSGDSDSSRSTSAGRYGSGSSNRFSSSGDVAGSTIRFVNRRRYGDAEGGDGSLSARRGEEGSSGGGTTERRQSSWDAIRNWDISSGQRATAADADGWTTFA